MADSPRLALVLYHYLYPDEVVSSVHLTELCTGLADRGWQVVGSACNRGARDEGKTYPKRLFWRGVLFRRVWRPKFKQAGGLGRLVNAVWMIVAWSLMSLNPRVRPTVVIIGTDPVLSLIVALVWRVVRPNVQIAHWCFDLYPEAAIAAGLLAESGLFTRSLRRLLGSAYRTCDLTVDIGACMRRLLQAYGTGGSYETITPWALVEPEVPVVMVPSERQVLFGEAPLGLLYSGTFGRAHSWDGVPQLARALASIGGRVTFSVQGNAVGALQSAIEDSGAPIEFAPFAPSHQLQTRLGAADIHIVSLRESWTGTVVPSKFFGALAIGRPVLFIGSPQSAIAQWIEDLHVGWVLDEARFEAVVQELTRLSRSQATRMRLFEHCHKVYQQNFSRVKCLERWDQALRKAVEREDSARQN